MRSQQREPYTAVHRVYAEGHWLTMYQGEATLFVWLEGDRPDPRSPEQMRNVRPFPVPMRVIFLESKVRRPGDSGELVVELEWAIDVGMV